MSAHKKYVPPTPEKTTPKPGTEKKNSLKVVTPDLAENIMQKNEIEKMKKVISNKIKDPKLAKRAAQIITDMLKPKK